MSTTTTATTYTLEDAKARGMDAYDEGKCAPAQDGTFLASLKAAQIGTQPGITGEVIPYLKAWAEGWNEARLVWVAGFDCGYTSGTYTGLHLKTQAHAKRYQRGHEAGAQAQQTRSESRSPKTK